MIYIKKAKNDQFYVTVVGKNGEPLSVSETLKSKQSAWKNIAAQAREFNAADTYLEVVDETVKKPAFWYFNPTNSDKSKK